MSSTRYATAGSPLRQGRWASSPEFHRGLLGNLVAKRCELLDVKDREIVWWLHLLSHQPNGWAHLHDDSLSLTKLCLDPKGPESFSLDSGSESLADEYFDKLRKPLAEWIAQRRDATVVTAIGRVIYDTLEYSLAGRCLTLVEGDARTGKTFAARAWCEQHPGSARFAEVPPGNDLVGFFRALARGLGVACNLDQKAVELRVRVESVLQTGHLLLCLDEAHRLWPSRNLRYSSPERVSWVMSMANQGVPICMVSTPQFLNYQGMFEGHNGWAGAQLTGRISHYVRLPGDLSEADLLAVARALLPELDIGTLKHVATYARRSAKYLAAVEHVARRARYLATRTGRQEVQREDVRVAMQQGVIPSDGALDATLRAASNPRRRSSLAPAEAPRSFRVNRADVAPPAAPLPRAERLCVVGAD